MNLKKRISDETITDDEITKILQHFQPIPEFVSKRRAPRHQQKKKEYKRFTNVKYTKGKENKGGALHLSFQLDRATHFRFKVTATEPYQVACIDSFTDTTPLVQEVSTLCAKLSSQASDTAAESPSGSPAGPIASSNSLFTVVSNLLSALNNLKQPTLDSTQQTSALQKQVLEASEEARRVWDLELLLLRCAAVGSDGSTFCTPIPHKFRHSFQHAAPEQLYAVSEKLSTYHLQHQQCELNRPEQELMAYILSLPWAEEEGSLSKCTTVSREGSDSTIQLELIIEKAMGDPSPRFTRLAKTHGTTRVYHGTQMGCVWSILNCGFWSLSDTKFCKNGALYGNGVYFTTSFKVASTFAGGRTSTARAFTFAWRHVAILSVLQLSHEIPLKDYYISCFPVFEAEIISPPPPLGGRCENDNFTRRDGNYFVVPNSRDIRVTKLHLTFELKKKTKSPMLWFAIILCVMLAIARQAR